MPSKRVSSACVDYVPALCTHRPSLLPIEWLSEAFGLAQRGRQRPLRAGKLSKLGHLEEVKVVTRSPLVNQRRDHYRVAKLPDHCELYQPLLRRAGPTAARAPPGRPPEVPKPMTFCMASLSNCTKVKTFNNGSLGSGTDEERSEMR